MKTIIFAMLLALGATTAFAKDGKDPFAVCRADLEKFCKNVQPGEGRQVKCMMDNRSRASGECAVVLNEKHKKEQEQHAKPQKVKH